MSSQSLVDINLFGLRIGLSGAVPNQIEWENRILDWEILNFVSNFSDAVFRYGGHLTHGCHPSFTPIILKLAESYKEKSEDPLVSFVMSDLWGDGYLAQQLQQTRYERLVELLIVERQLPLNASEEDIRNASLATMRKKLVEEMDVMVIIGGKSWVDSRNKPGTLEELEIAFERKIPVFLLGGFGGMAKNLASKSKYADRLGNGIDTETNSYLMNTSNAAIASALIINRCNEIQQEKLSSPYRAR